MTDKVQKIREWVKVRLGENTSKQSLPQFYGMMEEDARFLDFLDSLQEEPKKCMYALDDFNDEDRKVLCEDCEEKCEYSKKEEPVSQDLEEAIKEYSEKERLRKAYENESRFFSPTDFASGFKAGAHWKKDKFVAWLTRESDFLIQELKKGNKAYGLPEQYRAQLYKEMVNKLKD